MITPDYAIGARWVFDGVNLRENMAVVVGGDRIVCVVPRADAPPVAPVHDLANNLWLAPGFIDIQVNGGGDALFNDAPTPETIRAIVVAHRRFGTTALLPTLISDSAAKMGSALAAVETISEVEPGVLGIHLEGPFLSPDKAGIHDPRSIRLPTADDVAVLTIKRRGVTLVTLAPEQVPAGMIAKLAAAGVRVALGHSMATYDQTVAAMAEGLDGFTHLFNAMRPLGTREPGPIAAALESSNAWYGLIADGIHVSPAMLRLALRGAGHPMLVTDAMPPVGGTRSSFSLNGDTIIARDGCCRRGDGVLAGAYLDMATAVRNCVRLLNVPLTDALRFASTYPAAFLGLDDRLGRIAAGYRADMVALDGAKIEAVQTWVAGAPQ
ncbi:MAG TPA: N-acetylglucosamine-6-phosphate deacetylase [Xanthobacteraceae bacterium]